MCGIAGMVDLVDRRDPPEDVLTAMAAALLHRGPDEGGFHRAPGVGLVSRRLSIVDLAEGRQPMPNEDGRIVTVFNGEIFEHARLRADLQKRGHRFKTRCDTEVIPHLWEDAGEEMFSQLRGQFALALWDENRRRLVLARDRFGICPLYWARAEGDAGKWLLFGSEIKAILASGLIERQADLRGLDNIFTFFALPGTATCFEGIEALLPGHFLSVEPGAAGQSARIANRTYWEMEFPDSGQERGKGQRGPAAADIQRQLVDEFETLFVQSVERRLRADVPVVSYLSGGLDSSLVLAVSSRVMQRPLPAFTIQIPARGLDETRQAAQMAHQLGIEPAVVRCGRDEILGAYPRLIQATEAPISDTCCAALLLLAEKVHTSGYKVALTGEGADESLAGYPWFKWRRALGLLDAIPGSPFRERVWRALLRRWGAPPAALDERNRIESSVGGSHSWLILYDLVRLSRWHFFSEETRRRLGDYLPYDDLGVDVDHLRRWDPLNQSLSMAFRTHLPGLLLSLAGDRVAMHSSVETRYPFLDEDVVCFLAGLDPKLKLRGLREKYILRLVAERWLPHDVAWRPKAMFRAPFESLYSPPVPTFVQHLLSEESLRKTGYFDAESVAQWRRVFPRLRPGSARHFSVAIGLSGVTATQLWHHMFLDDSLADLPRLASVKPVQI